MNVDDLRKTFQTYGWNLSDDDFVPLMSIAITDSGRALERRVDRMESITKELLDKDGKADAFDPPPTLDSFRHSPIFPAIDELENPLLFWKNDLQRRYKKCFDIAHFYGGAGGWLILLCDVIRPLEDTRPLFIDIFPDIVRLHPELPSTELLSGADLDLLSSVRDILRESIDYLQKNFPEGLVPAFPPDATPEAAEQWYNTARTALLNRYRQLASQPPTPESHAIVELIKMAFDIGLQAVKWYGRIAPIFEGMLEYGKRKQKAIEDAQRQKAEKEAEARRKEYEAEFGRMPAEIPHASDHIDSFERNDGFFKGLV